MHVVRACENFVHSNIRWTTYLSNLKQLSKSVVKVWHNNGCPLIEYIYDDYVRSKRE